MGQNGILFKSYSISLLEPGVFCSWPNRKRSLVLILEVQIGFLLQESTFEGAFSFFLLIFFCVCHSIFIPYRSPKSVPSWRCTSISSSCFASGDELLHKGIKKMPLSKSHLVSPTKSYSLPSDLIFVIINNTRISEICICLTCSLYYNVHRYEN